MVKTRKYITDPNTSACHASKPTSQDGRTSGIVPWRI